MAVTPLSFIVHLPFLGSELWWSSSILLVPVLILPLSLVSLFPSMFSLIFQLMFFQVPLFPPPSSAFHSDSLLAYLNHCNFLCLTLLSSHVWTIAAFSVSLSFISVTFCLSFHMSKPLQPSMSYSPMYLFHTTSLSHFLIELTFSLLFLPHSIFLFTYSITFTISCISHKSTSTMLKWIFSCLSGQRHPLVSFSAPNKTQEQVFISGSLMLVLISTQVLFHVHNSQIQ